MREAKAAALLADVSEKKWQETVIAVAKARGYLVFHTYDSRKCTPGFPDLVLIHPGKGRLVVAELKTVTGKVEPEQERWLKCFTMVTGRPSVYVWRPGDLDEVNEVLT